MGWDHNTTGFTNYKLTVALAAGTYINYNHHYDPPTYNYRSENGRDSRVPLPYKGDEYQFSEPHKRIVDKQSKYGHDALQQRRKVLSERHAEQLLQKQQKQRKQSRKRLLMRK